MNYLDKKVVKNIAWLFFDKGLKIAINGYFIIYFARYLGPEDFGVYSYTLSIIVIMTTLSTLGLRQVVIKEILNKKTSLPLLLGSSFCTSMMAALFFFLLAFLGQDYLNADHYQLLAFSVILFRPWDVIKYYFESQLLSKYNVITEGIVIIIFVFVKFFGISQKEGLEYFFIVYGVEGAAQSLLLTYFYHKRAGKIFGWKSNLNKIKSLLRESWPLIISSGSWIIYTKLDQVMIEKLMSIKAVGYYSAASQLSDILAFIPSVITMSFLPKIINLKSTDYNGYLKSFGKLYDLVVFVMVIIAVLISMSSDWMVSILYGADYSVTAVVIKYHIWSIIFMSMAVVSGQFLIYEGLQKITMWRHLAGIIINFILNFALIPILGVKGAAIGTITSLFLCNFIFDSFNRKTKVCFKHKAHALFLGFIYGR